LKLAIETKILTSSKKFHETTRRKKIEAWKPAGRELPEGPGFRPVPIVVRRSVQSVPSLVERGWEKSDKNRRRLVVGISDFSLAVSAFDVPFLF